MPANVLAAIDANRRRLWALCYRMTGSRADADDLAQEIAARAIDRAEQVTESDATGWLLRLGTRVCLDHLRHRTIERRITTFTPSARLTAIDSGLDGDDASQTFGALMILRR